MHWSIARPSSALLAHGQGRWVTQRIEEYALIDDTPLDVSTQRLRRPGMRRTVGGRASVHEVHRHPRWAAR